MRKEYRCKIVQLWLLVLFLFLIIVFFNVKILTEVYNKEEIEELEADITSLLKGKGLYYDVVTENYPNTFRISADYYSLIDIGEFERSWSDNKCFIIEICKLEVSKLNTTKIISLLSLCDLDKCYLNLTDTFNKNIKHKRYLPFYNLLFMALLLGIYFSNRSYIQ